MVSGIVSLISLSDSSLLMCRNDIDFYILIFHPTTLPNSLTNSRNFLVVSLEFSMWKSLMWKIKKEERIKRSENSLRDF